MRRLISRGLLFIVMTGSASALSPSQSNSPTAAATFTRAALQQDGLDKAMRRRAGDGAKDCGSVLPGRDRQRADACAVKAFKAKRPFFVRYYLQGIDSIVADGMSGDAAGVVYLYNYDSDPSGRGNIGERVSERRCEKPKVVKEKGVRRIRCE